MTAYWCQHGADYVVIEPYAHGAATVDAIRQRAREAFAARGRNLSARDLAIAVARLDDRGPVTVRSATPADLAVWADHLASLEPATPTEEPML